MVSNSKFSLFAFTAQLDANLPAFLPLISYCLPSLNHASFILTAAPDSPSFMSFSYLFLCHLCCCLWCLEWPYRVLCLKELAFPVAQKALKMQTKERSHLEPMSTWACYDQIILLLDFIPFPHCMGQHATFFSLQSKPCTLHMLLWWQKWPGTKMEWGLSILLVYTASGFLFSRNLEKPCF